MTLSGYNLKSATTDTFQIHYKLYYSLNSRQILRVPHT